jgi:hypothetical protein
MIVDIRREAKLQRIKRNKSRKRTDDANGGKK